MTKLEAIGLETVCETMFKGIDPDIKISMALAGKLKLQSGENFFTFDRYTGELIYIRYCGFLDDLEDIRAVVRTAVCDARNRELLGRLAWSYEHADELIE